MNSPGGTYTRMAPSLRRVRVSPRMWLAVGKRKVVGVETGMVAGGADMRVLTASGGPFVTGLACTQPVRRKKRRMPGAHLR